MSGIIYPAAMMGALGLIFGVLLAFASQKFFVKTDERQQKIRELLPGANCGACGFAGCDSYAEAVTSGKAKLTACVVGGNEIAERLAEIMGVSVEAEEPKVAFLKCQGRDGAAVKNCVYVGAVDCREAVVLPGNGPSACPFSCLGLGTCVAVCKFDAVSIRDGIASIDIEKCVGCGVCVEQCPRGVLALVPKSSMMHVACSSPFKGADVRKLCSVGCIGCGICVKVCPKEAIEMKGSLAWIDPAKCINCRLCSSKCPVHAITEAPKK